MNTRLIKALALFVCALLMITAALPAAAYAVPNDNDMESTHEKLYAFWHQEAYGGLNNGEAVYDHEWVTGVGYEWTEPPTYDGGWDTVLVVPYINLALVRGYALQFTHDYWWSDTFVDEYGNTVCVDGIDTITPDLYGPLDLSDTMLMVMESPNSGQTHITSVCLDGCEYLVWLSFIGQSFCTELSALGCDLASVNLRGSFKRIDLNVRNIPGDIHVRSFAQGTVGFICTLGSSINPSVKKVTAYGNAADFLGWYINGRLVSTDMEYAVETGGRYVACFGGDADRSGVVDSSDALTVLRAALGIASLQNAPSCDINANGTLDSTDALLILRFALGMD